MKSLKIVALTIPLQRRLLNAPNARELWYTLALVDVQVFKIQRTPEGIYDLTSQTLSRSFLEPSEHRHVRALPSRCILTWPLVSREGCNESSDRTNFQLFILAQHRSPACIGCTADKMCVLHMAGRRQLCMPTLLGNSRCLRPISASPAMSCSLTNNYDHPYLSLESLWRFL